jgi:ATP-dependent Lon protease
VRTLEREIARLARKSLRRILEGKDKAITITPENLDDFAGVRKFRHGVSTKRTRSARSPVWLGPKWAANC